MGISTAISPNSECKNITKTLADQKISIDCGETYVREFDSLWYVLTLTNIETTRNPVDITSLIIVIANYYVEVSGSRHEGLYLGRRDNEDYLMLKISDIQKCKNTYSTKRIAFTNCLASIAVGKK